MKTAVEWFAGKQYDLSRRIYKIDIIKDTKYYEELNDILQQALDLEKQQILDARLDGFKISAEGWNGEYPFEGVTDYYIMLDINNDKYYEKTFKSE
jgi:hypothetical protein